jgi:septal ring-binding cell division protein DamX
LLRRFIFMSLALVSLSGCQSQSPLEKAIVDSDSMLWQCTVNQVDQDSWSCDRKRPQNQESTVVVTQPEEDSKSPAVKQQAAPATTDIVKASVAKGSMSSGYSLQLGAYRSLEKAYKVAAGLDLNGDIQVREIIVNGSTLAVILWGQYPSRDAAEVAAQTLTINYWVRSMESVTNATVRQ